MLILEGARRWMQSHGISHQQVEAVVANPSQRRPDPSDPTRTRCFGKGLCVVTGGDGHVLSVSESLVGAVTVRKQAKSKGGRGGNRWPTAWAEMRRRILASGLLIVEEGPHHKVRHPDSGRILGLVPSGNRPSRNGYSAITDLGKALLAAGYDTRNKT
jgi:hypothetical protein